MSQLDFWISSGAVFVLLVLSGFFSGSETALTAASRARMHALEQEGNKRAALVNKLRAAKDRLIGTLLLGNNLVNILASALATNALVTLYGEAGVAYATLGMTLLVLIFAEVLPKTYALYNANTMALGIAPVIQAVVWVLTPFVEAITGLVNIPLKLMRVKQGVSLESWVEELRGTIELHQDEEDEDVKEERDMLRSILDLGDVQVGEIMTHRRNLSAIDGALPPRDIVDYVLTNPFTRYPVWKDEQDNVVGILHAKALLREVQTSPENVDHIDVTTIAAEPWYIPDTTTLFDQLQAFRQRREHFALVVDEYGSLMGIVTLEDILEEIVGEISDEHDVDIAGVRPQPNGTFIIDGTVTIRDLNRQFEWRLPDEDYTTIAGLVIHEARRIPDPGQRFSFYGFRFEIIRRQRNQITLLRVTPAKG